MKKLLVLFSLLLLWSGCSSTQIEKELAKKDIHLVVVDIEDKINKSKNIAYAMSENLKSRLENQQGVTLEKRPKRATFQDEKKLFLKRKGVNYIVTGVIDNSSTKKIEYPPRKRSEGGSSAGWTEYRACISGAIKIYKPPFKQSSKNLTFRNICIRQNHKNYQEMLMRTAPKVIDKIFDELKEFFVKDKG